MVWGSGYIVLFLVFVKVGLRLSRFLGVLALGSLVPYRVQAQVIFDVFLVFLGFGA